MFHVNQRPRLHSELTDLVRSHFKEGSFHEEILRLSRFQSSQSFLRVSRFSFFIVSINPPDNGALRNPSVFGVNLSEGLYLVVTNGRCIRLTVRNVFCTNPRVRCGELSVFTTFYSFVPSSTLSV